MLLLSANQANAQSLSSMTVANELGTVLASEAACGLDFNQQAIANYIEQNVEATDMGFASMLDTMTLGHEYSIKEMSASAKTAHCTQIKRVAKAFGFID